MNDVKRILFIILIVSSHAVFAESQQFYGFRPQVSITKSISDRWDLNVVNVFASMHPIASNNPDTKAIAYFQTNPIYKYSPNLNFSLGYIYQRNNAFSADYINENRFFQQAVYGMDTPLGRFTQRARFEERFIQDRIHDKTPLSTRLRYQIALLVPLQGEKLDSGEFYLSIYNEFFFSLTGARNALYSENWSYAGVGYQTQQYGGIEVGSIVQRFVINQQHDIRYVTSL